MTRNRRPFFALALCASLALALPALAADTAPVAIPSSADAAALDAVIAGSWRSPANTARDKYRHPRETLQFFGVRPDQSLIEITPGAGWYTEILAPLVRQRGHYFGIIEDPDSVSPSSRDETTRMNDQLDAKLARNPDQYALTQIRSIDPAAPVLGPPGSADIVLTFRNVHNWVMGNRQAAMFKAIYSVLKPGGVLGVTDHRANPGAATDGMHGYLTEQQVIDYATAAGFKLDGKSEINANPKDRKDWPKGVWTLPPTFALGAVDRAKYQAVGESDRMTLRFVKPKN